MMVIKSLPYCPRCGTGLASHEVAQGYKEVSVNTVTVPFKLKDEDNTYLLSMDYNSLDFNFQCSCMC